jgi:hypothetical protein
MNLHADALAQLDRLTATTAAASPAPWHLEAEGEPPKYVSGGDVQDGWFTASLTRGTGPAAERVEIAALYWDATDNADVDEAVANGNFLVAARAAMPGLLRFMTWVLTSHAPDTTVPPGQRHILTPQRCRDCYQTWPCREAKPVLGFLRNLGMLPPIGATNYTEEPAALDAVTLDRADTLDPSLHAEALFVRAFLGEASRPPAGEAVADTSGTPGSQSVTFRYLSPIGRWELTLRASPEDPAPPIPEP